MAGGRGTIPRSSDPNGASNTCFNLLTSSHADARTLLYNGREITHLEPDAIARLGIARRSDSAVVPAPQRLENGESRSSASVAPRRFWRSERVLDASVSARSI